MEGEPREGVDARKVWDGLHALPRFRPAYPSETVVRFGMRYFGDAADRKVILDLGCGGGRHSTFFASLGHRVISIDYSLEGCRHTRSLMEERGAAALVACATMQALCLADSCVDGALAYGVLYHSDTSGFRSAVRELWRVLKPGGRLLVRTRGTSDPRFGTGVRIDNRTFVLTDDSTNERGMQMHFIDHAAIPEIFAQFRDIIIDRIEETFDGGTRANSDWIIQLVK